MGAAVVIAFASAGCAKRQAPPPPPPPPPQTAFQPGGQVTDWMVCGPWPIADVEALAREALGIDFLGSMGGEASADPIPGVRCRWGQSELSFRPSQAEADGVDLALHNAGTEGITYFATRIISDGAKRAFFHLETRAPLRVWLNGREVHATEKSSERAHFRPFETALLPGTNRLLIKVAAGKSPGRMRLTMADEAGHRHALAAAALRKTDTGMVRAVIEQGGEAGESLSLRCAFPFDTLGVFDDLTANWRISAPDGTPEWQGSSTLKAPAEVKLPPAEGFHSVRLEIPALLAEPIVIERRILTSKDPIALGTNTLARAKAMIADRAFAAYAGRLAESLAAAECMGEDKSPLLTLQDRMREAESNPLPGLRGRIAWCTKSTIDGSGQPFRLSIPEGYRNDYRHPLHVRITRDTAEPDDPALAELWRDAFVLWPTRRAIDSAAHGIGSRDVLDAIDFVMAHWSIDDRRIYISGDGPAGASAWRVAARYPDRFSALRMTGSPASAAPVENLSRIPLFSTHAEEDPNVPWWLSRAPLTALSRIGGFAAAHDIIQRDGDGSRMRQQIGPGIHWERSQRSPTPVERVHFVATDGSSNGGYWANVLEWNDGSPPAEWLARCSRDNGLFLDARNVAVLRIDLTRAPLDLHRPIRITVNGRRQGIADPPFGDSLYLSLSGEFLRVTNRPPFIKRRPYRPSDPATSVEAEPLLIVRGTGGSQEFKQAARLAAERLSRMAAPALGPTRPSHAASIWGIKDDREINDADIAAFNLLLLGGPDENTLVAKMAGNLPVKTDGGQIMTPGARSLPLSARAWWLHCPNPLAPDREIFICACDHPSFFTSGMPAPAAVRGRSPLPDFMLWTADGATLSTAGFFGAGWEWVAHHRRGVLPETICSETGWNEFVAAAIARAGAADFTVLPRQKTESAAPVFVPGETTWADALATVGDSPIWRFTVSGREMQRMQDQAEMPPGEGEAEVRIYPNVSASQENRRRSRIVARDAFLATRFLRATGSRVDEADFAGEGGVRQAVEWAIDAAPVPSR